MSLWAPHNYVQIKTYGYGDAIMSTRAATAILGMS